MKSGKFTPSLTLDSHDDGEKRVGGARVRAFEGVMRADRRIVLLVLTLVTLFAPLAYSDVPDQTWLGGLWDGGDYDVDILQFESTGCTVETLVRCVADPVLIILGVTVARPETVVVPETVAANQTRAPPTL